MHVIQVDAPLTPAKYHEPTLCIHHVHDYIVPGITLSSNPQEILLVT